MAKENGTVDAKALKESFAVYTKADSQYQAARAALDAAGKARSDAVEAIVGKYGAKRSYEFDGEVLKPHKRQSKDEAGEPLGEPRWHFRRVAQEVTKVV